VLSVFARPDGQIRDEVLGQVIAGAFALDAAAFKVAVTSGIVTITGRVDSYGLARQLIDTVRHVDGVIEVRPRQLPRRGCAQDHRTHPARPGVTMSGPALPSVRDPWESWAAIFIYEACEAIPLRRHCPGQVLGVALEPLSLPPVPPGNLLRGDRDRLLRSSRRPGISILRGGTPTGAQGPVHLEAGAADPPGRFCGGHARTGPLPEVIGLVPGPAMTRPRRFTGCVAGVGRVRPGRPHSPDGRRQPASIARSDRYPVGCACRDLRL
jgi:BON domain